jgi:hypothetical protein
VCNQCARGLIFESPFYFGGTIKYFNVHTCSEELLVAFLKPMINFPSGSIRLKVTTEKKSVGLIKLEKRDNYKYNNRSMER